MQHILNDLDKAGLLCFVREAAACHVAVVVQRYNPFVIVVVGTYRTMGRNMHHVTGLVEQADREIDEARVVLKSNPLASKVLLCNRINGIEIGRDTIEYQVWLRVFLRDLKSRWQNRYSFALV